MTIVVRQQLEAIEKTQLADYAFKNIESQGRHYPEPPDLYRTAFQIDRDRIIHCRSFRRLKGKTQVFISHYGDHYRTRLTHTLEVAQLARDLARSLGLNEDLAESIALAHDLGHTPFGHAGEEAMNNIMREFGSHFEHNEQSKRIVEILETGYPDFPGLNLTHEVREGLIKHQTAYDNPNKKINTFCLEAQVVDLADEIAYQNHDIDDGLRSSIINLNQLKELDLISEASAKVIERYGSTLDLKKYRNRLISHLIKLMLTDVLSETEQRLKKYNIKTQTDVAKTSDKIITFSPDFALKNKQLKDFLWTNLYFQKTVQSQAKRAQKLIKNLFSAYSANHKLLPKKFSQKIADGQKPEIIIKDYIAGMTDKFALKKSRDGR